MEISPGKSTICWDAEDEKFPNKKSFIEAISAEVPEISKILGKYVSISVSEEIRNKILDYKEKDERDVITFEENQKIAEELKQKSLIKSFPKNFKKQVAKQGYYEWEGNLTAKEIDDYNLISEDGTHLDEKIKQFKVKGKYNLSGLAIKEIIWPMEITEGFNVSFCRSLTSVNIPDYVTSIRSFAFYNCSSLTDIVIPNNVTSIGEWAFKGCTSLKSIIIPNSVTTIKSNTFSECSSLTSIVLPNSVEDLGSFAFDKCSSLTEVILPERMESIGKYAFGECSSLTKIDIPNGVTLIDSGTFSNCKSLTKVTIPSSVTLIGLYAFDNCNALEEVYIDKEKDSLGLFRIIPSTAKVYWKGEF